MNFDPAPNMSPLVRAHIWDAARLAAREDFHSVSPQEKEAFLLSRGWKDSDIDEDYWYCGYVFSSSLPGEPPSLPMGEAYLLARTMFYVENLSWAAGYDKCRGVLPED